MTSITPGVYLGVVDPFVASFLHAACSGVGKRRRFTRPAARLPPRSVLDNALLLNARFSRGNGSPPVVGLIHLERRAVAPAARESFQRGLHRAESTARIRCLSSFRSTHTTAAYRPRTTARLEISSRPHVP